MLHIVNFLSVMPNTFLTGGETANLVQFWIKFDSVQNNHSTSECKLHLACNPTLTMMMVNLCFEARINPFVDNSSGILMFDCITEL